MFHPLPSVESILRGHTSIGNGQLEAGSRCDPGFAGRTPASGAGPLYRESTFRATPADRAREQALLDRQAARDRTAMRLYVGLACLTLAGLVVSILWYFGIIQRWYATYTG